jgi:hypothetical protein
MSNNTTIDGVNYGPLAILIAVTGDEMRYTQSTVLDIYEKSSYEKSSCDHKDVNTLQRV